MILDREIATYQEKLPELARHEGKYVLVKGDEVVDVFPSYEEALSQGYRRFGLATFMVKQVQIPERVHFITRNIVPVPGH